MISSYFKTAYNGLLPVRDEATITRYAAHLKSLDEKLSKMRQVPDFPSGYEWLNTVDDKPLSLYKDLKDKLVVVDFWSSCCINCIHVLEEMNYLEHTFKDFKQVAFIGCHSAKFDNEKDFHMLKQAVLRYDIKHPVYNDKDFKFWMSNDVNCWPTIIVINPEGKLILKVTGENKKDQLEAFITAALAHYEGQLTASELPIQLESQKIQSKAEEGKKPELKPEQILALRQNLNNPGKIIIIADTEGLPYDTTDIMIIADSSNNRYVVVDLLTMKCLEVIGNGKIGFQDGDFKEAEFHHTQGMCHFLNQNKEHCLMVCDTKNHLIREINLNKKTVKKVAGLPGVRGYDLEGGNKCDEQEIASPWDISQMEDGRFIIAMAGTHQIWVLDLKNNKCQQLSGSGAEGNLNTSNHSAQWAQPSGVTFGTWNNKPYYFVADSESSCIRGVDLREKRAVGLVGGNTNPRDLFAFGDEDGIGMNARLQHPIGLHYCPVDKRLYVADSYNHKIKIMDFSKEQEHVPIKSWIGKYDRKTSQVVDDDIPLFNEPNGVWAYVKKSELKGIIIADTGNNCIRMATMDGKVKTLDIKGIPDVRETASECTGDVCEFKL